MSEQSSSSWAQYVWILVIAFLIFKLIVWLMGTSEVELSPIAPHEVTLGETAQTQVRAIEPVHFSAQGWETHCDPACRTFTTADFHTWPDAPATKLVLEIEPKGNLLVSALDTEEYNSKYYTSSGPIELRRGDMNYVPASFFFNDALQATFSINGEPLIKLTQVDDSHLRTTVSERLLASLRAGEQAKLVFFPLVAGKGKSEVRFSLRGFTEAYLARPHETSLEPAVRIEHRSVVAKELPGNRFGLQPRDLQVQPNPHGTGTFIFVPERRFSGVLRLFVWFVNGTEAVALNGPAKTATPALNWPRDVSFAFWDDTGLSVENATERGLAIARR